MNRLQQKCFLASMVLHGLLMLVILFGAAFFHKDQPPIPDHRINVVPSRLVDSASGGGGNPALPRTDDQVKGSTLTPQPTPPTPPTPKPPQPQVRPAPPPPTARAEPRRTEPRVEPAKPAVKPTEVPRPNTTAKTPTPPKPQLDLVPTVRNSATKTKEKEEAAAREARAAAERDAKFRRELANKLGESSSELKKAGFESGVKMEVGGPRGEAYANYALFVREVYDNAWQVMPDLANQDFAVTIEVTVSRTGRVISHRIVNRSGSASMDRSVQRALDKVKAGGLPKFPDGATDSERTFSIEFNLKAKRLLG